LKDSLEIKETHIQTYNQTSSPNRLFVDDCAHGDLPGVIANGLNCSDLVASNPGYCYQDYYRLKCCAACKQHYLGIEGAVRGLALTYYNE